MNLNLPPTQPTWHAPRWFRKMASRLKMASSLKMAHGYVPMIMVSEKWPVPDVTSAQLLMVIHWNDVLTRNDVPIRRSQLVERGCIGWMSNYGFCDLLEGYTVCLSEVIFIGMACPHSDHFVGVYHIFVLCVVLYFVWLIFCIWLKLLLSCLWLYVV